MENCIPNLVATENYIVQPVETIPISVVDYENVGIAHLVHTGPSIATGSGFSLKSKKFQPVVQNCLMKVIRLTSTNPVTKANELHPLEIEIQRDLELKEKQLVSQQRTSIAVPECAFEELVKRPSQFIQLQEKQICVSTESVNPNEETVHMQQIITDEKGTIIRSDNPPKSDQINIPHYFNNNRPVIVQGKQFIILPENHSVINSDWTINKIETEVLPETVNATSSVSELSEIPLTVQNYNITASNDNESKKCNKSKQKLDDDNVNDEDEDDDNIEPVCDYEPDPESSTLPVESQDAGKPNECYVCFKSFRQKKNMYAHIRKIHSTQPKIEGGILCPLCKMHALRQEHLRNHFEKLHDVRIEKEEKLFNTMEEFFSWKEYVERETLSFYVSKSSAKLLANNQQKTYYKCHRSGNYITPRKETRKKKLKVQGSNKIGATCPAAMEVTENVHGVNVIFWKTHVGHENDLAHLVLSREDKAKIRECLSSGVSYDNVLEKIKKEAAKSSSPPSKLTMVSKQDIRNLKIHDLKNTSDSVPSKSPRNKANHGRKPMKEKMLKRASQALVTEKAALLLNLLETTEVTPEFRPKICLMIDNLISTIKRRAVENVLKKEKNHKKRRRKEDEVCAISVNEDSKILNENGEEAMEESAVASIVEIAEGAQNNDTNSNILTMNVPITRKRGRPRKRKTNFDSSHKKKNAKCLSSQ